jgi:hypothetical protein
MEPPGADFFADLLQGLLADRGLERGEQYAASARAVRARNVNPRNVNAVCS